MDLGYTVLKPWSTLNPLILALSGHHWLIWGLLRNNQTKLTTLSVACTEGTEHYMIKIMTHQRNFFLLKGHELFHFPRRDFSLRQNKSPTIFSLWPCGKLYFPKKATIVYFPFQKTFCKPSATPHQEVEPIPFPLNLAGLSDLLLTNRL